MAVIALVAAIVAVILVLAQRMSTHRIEWKPLTLADAEGEADTEQELVEEDDDKILSEALDLQRKGKKSKDVDPLDTILETNNF